MFKTYLKLLRPHQYLKNLFIFTPIIFGLQISNIHLLQNALLAFIAFSLVASSIYIFNDIKDIEEDKKHPSKKLRPITSGKISIKNGVKTMILLFLSGTCLAYFLNTNFLFILLSYFGMNILYSLWLKHISIVDISVIATGFVLRVFAGSVVVDIFASEWIIIMTFLLALFLALAKRRDDVLLTTNGETTRKSIDGYNLEFINASMIIMASIVIVAYIMYSLSPVTTEKFNTNDLYLTTFFVITGLIRYMQLTFVENNSGSPTNVLIKDRFLQLTILLWFTSFIIIIY